MDVLVRIVDARSKQEIDLVNVKKEILELVLQGRKFIYQELKYDVVEFIPDIFEASVLAVSKTPNVYTF